jgi:hypothetical protein
LSYVDAAGTRNGPRGRGDTPGAARHVASRQLLATPVVVHLRQDVSGHQDHSDDGCHGP